MIYAITLILIAMVWLMIETKWLSIRLPYGAKLPSGIKLLTAGKIETVLMLPEAKKESYFIPCEIPESEYISKNIVNVGAKIIY